MLGAKTIVVHPAPCAKKGEEQKRFNLTRFRALAPVAREYGIRIAVENMWGYDNLANRFVPNVCSVSAELAEYIDDLMDEITAIKAELNG